MKIAFFNTKGGVGCSRLAFSIAKDLDFLLMSNALSSIEDFYDKAKIVDKLEVIPYDNVIYDLEHCMRDDNLAILKASDLIFIPTLLEINSILHTSAIIEKLKPYDKKIILIINRINKATESRYEDSQKALEETGKEIFILHESTALEHVLNIGQSITEQHFDEKNFRFKEIYTNYQKILQRIKDEKIRLQRSPG